MSVTRSMRRLIVAGVFLLGFVCLGIILWYAGGSARAASPLFFIIGLLVSLMIAMRTLRDGAALLVTDTASRQTAKLARRTWNKGIPQIIGNLYINHIKNYPEWIKVSPHYVPASVTAAARTTDGVRVTIALKEYTFTFTELQAATGDTRPQKEALLELYEGETKYFALRLRETMENYVPYWLPVSLEYFVPGTWIKDMMRLKKEVIKVIKDSWHLF